MKNPLAWLSMTLALLSSSVYAGECRPNTTGDAGARASAICNTTNIVANDSEETPTTYISDVDIMSKGDNRKVKTSHIPEYLNAVGKLIIKTDKKRMHCSASLTDIKEGRASKILVTAEHCLSNSTSYFSPLSIISIDWETIDNQGNRLVRQASLLHMDWKTDTAMLKLNEVVPYHQVRPLLLVEGVKEQDETLDLFVFGWGESATLAGYSADRFKGQAGDVLTYTDGLIDEDMDDHYDLNNVNVSKVQAHSYGGASGGGLILRLAEDAREDLDLAPSGEQELFIGVITNVEPLETDEKELFLSGVAKGSPETNVVDFSRFLEKDYIKFYQYNN